MLERLFRFQEHHTTVQREIAGGVTTFLTMAYIIFVQPVVLRDAGMDFGAVLVATCIASAIATFLMALLANYPIALA
ncbi:MAG: NCS2 family permease, partial [Calditrichaeota bacterium]